MFSLGRIFKICRRREPLERWAKKNIAYIEEQYSQIIREGDAEDLRLFAGLCHQLVTDRDISFTLGNREDLYRRWLSSGQPCLLASKDEGGTLVAASVLLPLKETAYYEFCEGSLDTLKINASHIAGPAEDQRRRFLLIDMLCRHKQASKSVPGVAFRNLIRHIALFYDPENQLPPMLFCGTENEGLVCRLKELEFEPGPKEHHTEALTYSTDLGRKYFKSPLVRAYYAHLIDLCRTYNEQARANACP
jgi:hypothetical protein